MEHDIFFNSAADTILKGLIENNNSSVERCASFASLVIEGMTEKPYGCWREVVRYLKENNYIAFPEGVDTPIYSIGYITESGISFAQQASFCNPSTPILPSFNLG